VDAVDAAALGPFKKQATITDEKTKKSLLHFGCDSFGWYNFGISLKLLPPDATF